MEKYPDTVLQSPYIDWATSGLSGVSRVVKDSHGDQGEVYHIDTSTLSYILKVASNLQDEHDRLLWLQGKVLVPVVQNFARVGEKDALLMSELRGKNLASHAKDWPSAEVVERLAEVIHAFHKLDTQNCPFGNVGLGMVLTHGDACLPNFIFDGNSFSGYVDLGDMGMGAPEIDLSAAIWSLQYNLGPGYGSAFLDAYGYHDTSEKTVEQLRLQYEDAQRRWGLVSQ